LDTHIKKAQSLLESKKETADKEVAGEMVE